MFEIHFGKGIVEHEQIFDVLRKNGPETIDGNVIEIKGSGAWKSLIVYNETSGEVIAEKKFYKAEFNEVLNDPEYSPYCDKLLEAAMIKVMASEEFVNIDHESYEEVRSIAMDLESNIVSPED